MTDHSAEGEVMEQARCLISAFHELNRTGTRTVAHFTPSLIGMFGSLSIFDAFLSEVDTALVDRQIPPSLQKRAINLTGTFIPQVAEYNSIDDFATVGVTCEELAGITADGLENRRRGATLILAALMCILAEVSRTG
jgi:hypothetical protein